MTSRIVSDTELEKALDWLRDNAPEIGAARYRLEKAEHMLKVIRAIEMKRHDGSVSKAEVLAMASEPYKAAVTELASAAGEFEQMRSLRRAAELKIEAWRSEQANYRGMKV